MRLLFELLLFVVLAFFFGAIALIFYKWLAKKFLKTEGPRNASPDQSNTPSNENKGE